MEDIIIDLDELPPATTSGPAPPPAAPQATSQTLTQVENVPAASTPAPAQNTAAPAEKKKPDPKPAAKAPNPFPRGQIGTPASKDAVEVRVNLESAEEMEFVQAFVVIVRIIYRNLIKK